MTSDRNPLNSKGPGIIQGLLMVGDNGFEPLTSSM